MFRVPGWKRITTVTVLVTDFAISAVNYDLGPFDPCDGSRSIDCRVLGVMYGRSSVVARTLDSPFTIVGDNVLVFPHVQTPPSA